jgi:hypothetical protein
MKKDSQNTGVGSADWLMNAVRNNPEGLLLLAAGCALLLRTGRSRDDGRTVKAQRHSSNGQREPETQRRTDSRGWEMPESVSQAADTAREYATNVSKAVSETADQYANAAGEYVDEARRTIAKQSERIAEQAQGTIERIAREQPLAVAIAGLAAGAAVAAAFPTTRMERETLGGAGKTLSDAASSAGERLSEAASAVGERLMEVAEDKGLTKEGLKEVASDVANTFGKSVAGDVKQTPSQTKPLGDTSQSSVAATSKGSAGQSTSPNAPTQGNTPRPGSKVPAGSR